MLVQAPYYLVANLIKMAVSGPHVAGEEHAINAEETRLGNEAMSYLSKNKESEHIDMKELKDMAEEELMLGAKDVGMGFGLRNRVMSNLCDMRRPQNMLRCMSSTGMRLCPTYANTCI